jgi:YD repeat-containing protein
LPSSRRPRRRSSRPRCSTRAIAPLKTSHADGSFVTQAYGLADPVAIPGGFLTTTTTDELNRPSVVVSDAYGRAIRQTATKAGQPVTRKLTYDMLDRLTGLADPLGNTWSNVFDTLGRRTSVSDPDLGTWTFAFDDAGKLTVETDAKAQQTAFAYDRLGRTLTQTMRAELPLGNALRETTTFSYDEARSGFFDMGQQTHGQQSGGDAERRSRCPGARGAQDPERGRPDLYHHHGL